MDHLFKQFCHWCTTKSKFDTTSHTTNTKQPKPLSASQLGSTKLNSTWLVAQDSSSMRWSHRRPMAHCVGPLPRATWCPHPEHIDSLEGDVENHAWHGTAELHQVASFKNVSQVASWIQLPCRSPMHAPHSFQKKNPPPLAKVKAPAAKMQL